MGSEMEEESAVRAAAAAAGPSLAAADSDEGARAGAAAAAAVALRWPGGAGEAGRAARRRGTSSAEAGVRVGDSTRRKRGAAAGTEELLALASPVAPP